MKAFLIVVEDGKPKVRAVEVNRILVQSKSYLTLKAEDFQAKKGNVDGNQNLAI